MPPKKILLTGAAGTVGKEIARQILLATEGELVAFLHAKDHATSADAFLHAILPNASEDDLQKFKKRLSVVEGDITEADLALTEETRNILEAEITDIIHCAGSTNFSLSLEASRRFNLQGTKNVLGFCRTLKHAPRFGYISTAFVAGKRTGDVLETELQHDKDFANSYEQSKYEAEHFLLSEQDEIPVCIYRLSTVLGNSITGEVDNFTAPHQMTRLMFLGLVPMMPGTQSYPVDFIAIDHAASAVVNLFLKHFSAKEVFHITAGAKHSYLLGDVIEDTFRLFGEYSPQWKKKDIPKPLLASKEAFDLFLSSIEETGNPLMLQIIKNTKYFADQLLYPKNFKRDNVIKYLPDYDDTLPEISEFYARVLKFCLQTGWKRKNHD